MIPEAIKRIYRSVRSCAPRLCYVSDSLIEWWRLSRKAKLTCQVITSHAVQETLEMMLENVDAFRLFQKRTEVIQLLTLLKRHPPHRICEIGGGCGGTLLLFSQFAPPDAKIVSIDMHYRFAQRRAFRHFARLNQRITCIRADSQKVETVARVKRILGGEPLDFLFIDGDHSYSGVSTDFCLYAQLVKPGGIIAFHDIIPDMKTRCGRATGNYVGDVPRFWSELRAQYGSLVEEFVEDPEQDGYGIGVLRWQGKPVAFSR